MIPYFVILTRYLIVVILILILSIIALTPHQAARAQTAINVGCNTSALITAINNASSGDTLELASDCTYTLTAAYDNGSGPYDGLPGITGTMTINGNGATIERSSDVGTPNFRIFWMGSGANLTLNNLTISGGYTTYLGGGIYKDGGTLTINNSIIAHNTSTWSGGGIYNNSGTLTVSDSTLSSNGATGIVPYGYGGGIFNENGGEVTLTNSTLSGNRANVCGGGISNWSGDVTVDNSTLSGNVATTHCGGGIHNWTGAATMSIGSSTITNNTAVTEGGGIINDGGTVNLGNSIVAGNTAATGPDIKGTVNVLNYSLIGDNSGLTVTTGANNITGVDPLLNPLANNGGITYTHSLQEFSPAIDAGGSCSETNDQRGVDRSDGNCDIGAYEYHDPNTSLAITVTCSTSELIAAIEWANANISPDEIELAPDCTYTLTAAYSSVYEGLPIITDALTIHGNGATISRQDGSPDFRIFHVASGANLSLTNLTVSGGYTTYNGGGIYNNGGALDLANSTLSGNAAADGGGVYSNGGTVTLTNSTLSGNAAGNYGGGVHNEVGTLVIHTSTITSNSAANGGGIYSNGGAMDIDASVVAGNMATTTDPDISGAVNTLNYSLVGDDTGLIIADGVNNIVGNSTTPVDPLLRPLANNLGPTWTHALLAGSPAIGTGGVCGQATDQRGFERDATCDMGAYEIVPLTITLDTCLAQDLIEAINMANNNLSDDVIELKSDCTYMLTNYDNDLGSANLNGLPVIPDTSTAGTLTIDGNGATVERDNNGSIPNFRIFYVDSGAHLTLDSLTIRGAFTTYDGGGIYNNGGTLTLTNSTISGVSALSGGGIYNLGGTLTLTNSTISGNTAGNGSGGGIVNDGGAATISSSTITDNNSTNSGAGIHNPDGTLDIDTSIVADNTADSGGPDISGTVNTLNYSLVGVGTGMTITTGANNSVGNSDDPVDPLLGPLADNGGPTPTHLLIFSSPAIDAVPPGDCPMAADQRGVSRPQGTNCDIGAFELSEEDTETTTVSCNSSALITAIANANTTARDDILELAPNCNYVLNSVNNNDGGPNGLPVIESLETSGRLTINGNGSTIRRHYDWLGTTPKYRLFFVDRGWLSLDHLTVSGGNPGKQSGGGIYNNRGSLNISNSTISDNVIPRNLLDVLGACDKIAWLPVPIIGDIFGITCQSRILLRDDPLPYFGGGIFNDRGTATISNSTIAGNQANITEGGGIYNTRGTVTISNNSIIRDNTAESGGGVFNNGGVLTVKDSTISSNAVDLLGGGIANADQYMGEGIADADGEVTLNNSTISDNSADGFLEMFAHNFGVGGGIFNAGTLTVINSTISSNSTSDPTETPSDKGGGIFNCGTVDEIHNSMITDNAASDGGGIYNSGTVDNITNSTISGNTIHYDGYNGGGIYNSGTLTVTTSTISGNNSTFYGGGIYNKLGTLTVTASTISGNYSALYGGGIYNRLGTLTVTASTVSDNTATSRGGGIYQHDGTVNIGDSIVAGNHAGVNGPDVYGSVYSLDYNFIQNLSAATLLGTTTHNITGVDPLLDPLADNGGPTWTHALQLGSPAIDAIPAAYCRSYTDQRGVPRLAGTGCDIGAFEVTGETTNTTTLTTCEAGELIAAITAANDSLAFDFLELKSGCTYTVTDVNNNDSFDGSPNGLPIIESMNASGGLAIYGNGATIERDSSADPFRIFYVTAGGNLSINNLTISGGDADNSYGGGIFNDSGTLIVNNSILSNNTASLCGGGISNQGKTVTISNSTLSNNESTTHCGGGIHNQGSSANTSISNSTLSNNSAATLGGGILNDGGTVTLSNSTLLDNSANGDVPYGYGGGIFNENGGTVTISSSTLSSNTANVCGGGISNWSSTVDINNSTLSGNVATIHCGGGIHNWEDGNVAVTSIRNSTLYENTALNEGGGIINDNGTVNLENTIVAGNSAANGPDIYFPVTSGDHNVVGNIAGTSTSWLTNDITGLDPMLDPLANNGGRTQTHSLDVFSPAIDAGLCEGTDDDQRGFARDSNCDIGAYEYQYPHTPMVITPTCSVSELITAINRTNVNLGDDVIELEPGCTYTLTTAYSSIYEGLPIITGTLAINGNGATITRVSADNFRIFQVASGANLSLNSLTISGGLTDYDGGGIYNNGGTLTLTNSTISGSTAANGGGIYNAGGTLALTNSTISGNTATASGGGICNYLGAVTLGNSTISDNSATDGGGIYNPDGTLNIDTSIVAGNTATGSSDISGTGNTLNYSLVGDSTGLTITTGTNNIVGTLSSPVDPMLGTLTENSGPTQTMALLPSSPAIDTGGACGERFDQRGFWRDSTCDIGAYEHALPTITLDTCLAQDLINAITASNIDPDANVINLALGCTYALTAPSSSFYEGLPIITGTLTINGNGATIERGRNAPSFRIFHVTSGGDLRLDTLTISGGYSYYDGGGIYNGGGRVTITNSTITGSTAANGGGVFNHSGTLIVDNSTITGSTAANGGGIRNYAGPSTISNSTISNNSATDGGGIYNSDGTVNLGNTIVANSLSGGNCSGVITDNGYNLSSDSSCNLAGIGSFNDTDPMLEALADNGGATWTHSLQMGSPAIDTGGICDKIYDQRGFRRDSLCDIGSYEMVDVIITEQELFQQLQTEIVNGNYSINFTLVDFTPGVLTFTVRTVDGTVGTVVVKVTDTGSGFVTFQIGSISVASEFAETVNRELMPLLVDSLDVLIVQKTGVSLENLDTMTVGDTVITIGF